MKNHICIFVAYLNFDIIKSSFDSIKNAENVDFFIIENASNNSDKIEQYFLDKNLIGYIRFNENIASNAVDVFIENYNHIIKQYKYITITDGDLYVYDIDDLFNEIKYNLQNDDISVCASQLYKGNSYVRKDKVIGVEKYESIMNSREMIQYGFIEKFTGCYFLTIKNEDIHLLNPFRKIDGWPSDCPITDSEIYHRVCKLNKMYTMTKKNLVYHLTWDLYYEGSEYYKFKIENPKIWTQIKYSEYKIIK